MRSSWSLVGQLWKSDNCWSLIEPRNFKMQHNIYSVCAAADRWLVNCESLTIADWSVEFVNETSHILRMSSSWSLIGLHFECWSLIGRRKSIRNKSSTAHAQQLVVVWSTVIFNLFTFFNCFLFVERCCMILFYLVLVEISSIYISMYLKLLGSWAI